MIDDLNNIKYDPDYTVPLGIFKNPHLQTMFARLFRYCRKASYQRERVSLVDGDFIDIDWSRVGSKSLAVICPGFESDSYRRYVVGSSNLLNENGFDSVVVNHRGTSGVPGNNYIFGIGDEKDYAQVIDSLLANYDYQEIFLIGYSTGGNLTVKYVVDQSNLINPRIKKVFVTSPALHLVSTMEQFNLPMNHLYLRGFLSFMFKRLWVGRKIYKREIKFSDLFTIKTPEQFYDKFCYPWTKIKFIDYLAQHSACGHLSRIKVPLVIIDSIDDPFLDPRFYPYLQAMANDYITLRLTKYGGHVGFVDFKSRYYWSERKMIEFLKNGGR